MSDDQSTDRLADLLRAEAAAFTYPPTPDLAARWGRRPLPRRPARALRFAGVALAAALLLAALLVVPEVRAAALRLLQIGVVRVQVLPEPPPTALPGGAAGALPQLPTTATPLAAPAPSPEMPPLDLGLTGRTTLAEAARRVEFPIRLPAYPEDLGPPDQVYLQQLDGAALILVWLDPASPDRALMSLHVLTSDIFVEKTILSDETERIAETQVGGRPALWIRGPHLLEVGRYGRASLEPVRIVEGNTLIWTEGELTYRLESELTLEEALRVAESLR